MKKTPEEIARHCAEKDRNNLEKGMEQLVPTAVGKKTLDLLRTRDEVTLAALIDSFEADAEARRNRGDSDIGTMQARVCIRALRALQTDPAAIPAGSSEE